MTKRRRPPIAPIPPPPRDRDADQALFERALAQLPASPPVHPREGGGGGGAEPGKDRDESDGGGGEGGARFARRVARDEVEPALEVDLHGLDREGAVRRLGRALAAAPRRGVVLVVHGRGRGVLEAATIAELDRHPRVAEHLPAPRRLGGPGARLVRLR